LAATHAAASQFDRAVDAALAAIDRAAALGPAICLAIEFAA
jgi:hypothetical protein